MNPPVDHVDVYPVGALAHLRRSWLYLTTRKVVDDRRTHLGWRIRRARMELSTLRRTVVRQVRHRKWRELKNTFNGYLAEPYHWPEGLSRCGTGWTRNRAMRSLRRRGWRH